MNKNLRLITTIKNCKQFYIVAPLLFKRTLIVVSFLTVFFNVEANTFYISPSGNDASGNGSLINPWKTLKKATTTVTVFGDIIHVNAGVYIETQQCYLQPGVSIEGDGNTSVIQSNFSAFYEAYINCSSPVGTNGNQHISNLKFDGRNIYQSFAIDVKGRSNFHIYNCEFLNFDETGVIMTGQHNNAFGAPAIFATGCSFHDNIMNNCSKLADKYGRGCFMFGGMDGMLIYNNTITQNQKPTLQNGWPIKGWCESHIKNCKIYNNNLTTTAILPGYNNGDGDFWDFAIELFDMYGGNEIYNNVTTGSIDLNHQGKGSSAYSVWIHDNLIGFPNQPGGKQSGIISEFNCESEIIEKNIIRNCVDGIIFSTRPGTKLTDCVVRNNLIYNIGSNAGGYGHGIGNFADASNNVSITNMKILNNTLICRSTFSQAASLGITFFDCNNISNMEVRNNIIQGFHEASLYMLSTAAISNSNFTNNDFYLNAYNTPFTDWRGTVAIPASNTISNNLLGINPNLTANYLLNAGSPMIDAGINVGLPFVGNAPDIGYAEYNVSAIGNTPPVAIAGNDTTIALPNSIVNLNGSGFDSDGIITGYLWKQISGPTGGIITNNAVAQTNVTALTLGVYKFELSVTDNAGAIGRDTMQVTVNPDPNIPPTANAGSDTTIALPINNVTVVGTGTDTDGTVVAYLWSKISGPAASTIVNATSATTLITDLDVDGIYKFVLTVTDNNGATGKDTIQITVLPDPNQHPVVNAGVDQTITLPLNVVQLTGSAVDPDGTIVAYLWTKLSGPTAGNITNTDSAATSVTGLTNGVYRFILKATDNLGAVGRDTVNITVNLAPNIPPTAIAGADQTITLPTNVVSVAGQGVDTDGTIVGYLWKKIAGPNAGIITNANYSGTTITGLIQGVYKYELTVTDDRGGTGKDTLQITVLPDPNIHPTANAGADQTITLPINTVTLIGSGNDPDGTIVAYLWRKLTGPASGNITTPNSATTSITGLGQGIFTYEIRVTDNSGAYGRDTVQVTVNPAPNVPPTANAGADISITFPVNNVTLNGTGTDTDGTIVAYSWVKLSGPAAGTIIYPGSSNTPVNGLVAGIYKFQLTVTDNNGATASSTMQVFVYAPNIPPTANAGLSQSITLPANSATLTGSGNDVDGTIASYIWRKVSGPATGNINSPNSAVTILTNLSAGIYVFELTVTDNSGATGKATVQVTVNAANIPPVANAGPDQLLTLPQDQTVLTGSGTDIDGTIVAYQWRQISGPPDKLTALNAASTIVHYLVEGTYSFELTVTDNKGAIGRDTVNLTVVKEIVPDDNTLKIYPNPIISTTTLDIKSTSQNAIMQLNITDLQGKTVYKKQLIGTSYNTRQVMDLSTLAKGTYLVTVYFDDGKFQTIKAVKM